MWRIIRKETSWSHTNQACSLQQLTSPSGPSVTSVKWGQLGSKITSSHCRNLLDSLTLKCLTQTRVHLLESLQNISGLSVRALGPAPSSCWAHCTLATCALFLPSLGKPPGRCWAHTGGREMRLESRIKLLSSSGALSSHNFNESQFPYYPLVAFPFFRCFPHSEDTKLRAYSIYNGGFHSILKFLFYAL